MTLTGNTLAAYNNLPGFPPTPKLGNLLNALNVPNPAYVGLTTPVEIDIFVETTGDDETGTGTSVLPYATLDRALADFINAELPATSIVRIYMGAGDFAKPTLAHFVPVNILVMVYGDMSNPVYEGPAEVSSAVATYNSLRTVNIGAYSSVITDDSHWMLFNLNGQVAGYPDDASPCTVSVSPDVRFVAWFDKTALASFGVYPYSTRFVGGLDAGGLIGNTQDIGSATAIGDFGLRFYGVHFTGSLASFSMVSLLGCKFGENPFDYYVFDDCLLSPRFVSGVFVLSRNTSIEAMCSSADQIIMESATLNGGVVLKGGAFKPRTCVSLYSMDFRCAGETCILPYPAADLEIYLISVSAAIFIDATLAANAVIRTTAGVNPGHITGTVTGTRAVALGAGAQGIGLEAGCSGSLANSSTPGADIVVGGNAVVAWAALPTNDSAAGSPQFCRAT